MSARNVISCFTSAVVLTLSLAGCSGADQPIPKSSSSPSGATAAALKDESAGVLGHTPPAPVAKTDGMLSPNVAEKIATVPATAEIISVRANNASTILTWQLSSATDIPIQGGTLNPTYGAQFWPDAVRLIDPVGKKSYAVNTMIELTTYCVCSRYPLHVGPDPVRMTAEYPAIPTSATSLSVRIPNFAPVTVPVTR